MKRNKHNLSHYRLLTGDMGKLLPVGVVEVLPGDSFQHSTNVLLRLSPMTAPVMHGMQVRVHHWFVPNRLTWSGWETFITGGPDGRDAQTPPTIVAAAGAELLDYMGVAPGTGLPVNAFPVRAYNLIFNEYYRDQDLVAERAVDDTTLASIAWEKDYFTAARPWPQKGDEVTIPLGTFAPVVPETAMTSPQFSGTSSGLTTALVRQAGSTNAGWNNNPGGAESMVWADPGLLADLSAATAASVNDLRRAFAVQRFQEARARYGSRYSEYLRYLGVRPSDARLAEPEYLGGGRASINVSEVLQTAPETDANPEYGVGDMYGHGIAAMRSNRYRRFFEEHGYVLTLLSVRPKAIYQNGVERHWLKRDKEDYWQKELEFIGQQPVFAEEVYAENATTWGETFGYADRYSEYRSVPSKVSGEFRDVLNYWHLARNFTAAPVLNSSFVQCEPSKRIFNVQTNDVLWIMCQHQLVARRLVARSAAGRIM